MFALGFSHVIPVDELIPRNPYELWACEPQIVFTTVNWDKKKQYIVKKNLQIKTNMKLCVQS